MLQNAHERIKTKKNLKKKYTVFYEGEREKNLTHRFHLPRRLSGRLALLSEVGVEVFLPMELIRKSEIEGRFKKIHSLHKKTMIAIESTSFFWRNSTNLFVVTKASVLFLRTL